VCLILGCGLTLAAQASTEIQVKAAFLFNFPKFIDWPNGSLDHLKEFKICVLDDRMPEALAELIQNEFVGGKPLHSEKKNPTDSLESCQLVYFSSAYARDVPAAIRSLDGSPILTVGEDAAFLRNGGMIRFNTVNKRVRFEINREAAQHARLEISSRLLRLADVVQNREPGR
jgi:hypothetical protein